MQAFGLQNTLAGALKVYFVDYQSRVSLRHIVESARSARKRAIQDDAGRLFYTRSLSVNTAASHIPFRLLRARDTPPLNESMTAPVGSILLAMLALSVLTFCIASRTKNLTLAKWRSIALARWLVLGVYCDSWAFVFSSTVLQSIGLGRSQRACDTAILMCLVFYLSSKVILYFFLVERVWIVQGGRGPRLKDKLYLFNSLGMLLPYCIIICLTFVFRRAELNEHHVCKIGLKLPANVPLLIFDVSINVFLTTLFLRPLRQVCSSQTGSSSGKLQQIAKRTFIGSACTLFITVTNLVTLLVLKGKEPGWVCFVCCNSDVLVSALVLHWVTGIDNDGEPLSICRACKAKHSKNSGIAAGGGGGGGENANAGVAHRLAKDVDASDSAGTANTVNSRGVASVILQYGGGGGKQQPDLGRGYHFGGIVRTECSANPPMNDSISSKRSKRKSRDGKLRRGKIPLQIETGIPMGRISCKTETTQDRTEIESIDERLYLPTIVGLGMNAPPLSPASQAEFNASLHSPNTVFESENYHPEIETGDFPAVLTGPMRDSVRIDIGDLTISAGLGQGGIFEADMGEHDDEEKGLRREFFSSG